MWICLNKAFLSIVDKAQNKDCLLVRARRQGDIQGVFPDAKVKRTPGNDYLFRAEIDRILVADTIAAEVRSICYDNFKNSVRNDKLHDAYSSVWSVMGRLQPGGPYSRGSRKQNSLI